MLEKTILGLFKQFLVHILTLSLMMGVSGCDSSKDNKEAESTTQVKKATPEVSSSGRILIGVIEWIGWTPLIVAEKKGFFKDEELDVKVVVFPDPWSRYNAFLAGNIQFTTGLTGDMVLMAVNGCSLKIVMELDFDNTDVILVRNEIKDLGELEGKKVACDMHQMEYFFLEKALERYGLTTDNVTVIDMPAKKAISAFIRNKVGAVAVWMHPLVYHAIKAGSGKVAITAGNIPGIMTDSICGQKEFIEENYEITIKMLKCWLRALKWGKEHPNEYYEIALKSLYSRNTEITKKRLLYTQSLIKQLKPDEIKERMKKEGPLYQYCQEILDFYYEKGMIDSKPDPKTFINHVMHLKAIKENYD